MPVLFLGAPHYLGATTAFCCLFNNLLISNAYSKYFLKTNQTSLPLDAQKTKGEIIQTTHKVPVILGPRPSPRLLCTYNSGDSFLTGDDSVTVKLYPPVQGALEH